MNWISPAILLAAAAVCSGMHVRRENELYADDDPALGSLTELEGFDEDREDGGAAQGDDETPSNATPNDEATTAPSPGDDVSTPVPTEVSTPTPDTPASDPVTWPPTKARKMKRPWWKRILPIAAPTTPPDTPADVPSEPVTEPPTEAKTKRPGTHKSGYKVKTARRRTTRPRKINHSR
ncbi:hypothetical protein EMCRGX_G015859 [Ephydatia muelleri]|eukprot:Em0005g70a